MAVFASFRYMKLARNRATFYSVQVNFLYKFHERVSPLLEPQHFRIFFTILVYFVKMFMSRCQDLSVYGVGVEVNNDVGHGGCLMGEANINTAVGVVIFCF